MRERNHAARPASYVQHEAMAVSHSHDDDSLRLNDHLHVKITTWTICTNNENPEALMLTEIKMTFVIQRDKGCSLSEGTALVKQDRISVRLGVNKSKV